MEIKIKTPTDADLERVFDFFKIFCKEQLQEFELLIEGTELEYIQKKNGT